MDLIGYKISDFLELLASNAPAPGGGAAAALAGAAGISLVEMVASLTIGKNKYIEFWPVMEELKASALELRNCFYHAVNADAEAFELVSRAYKMESDTPEKKENKDKALQEALIKATEAPLSVMELSVKAARLCEKAVGGSNPNVAGDLSVSIILLKAAACGAQVNININLQSIKDKNLAEACRQKSALLLKEITGIEGRIPAQ